MCVYLLLGCDGRGARGNQSGQVCVVVLGQHRLFDEERMVWLPLREPPPGGGGRGAGPGGGVGRGGRGKRPPSGGCREPTVEVDCEVELGAERLAHEGGTFDYFGVVRLAGQMCALRRPIHFYLPHPPPPRPTLGTGGPGDVGWTVAADPTVDTHLVAHVAAK